jgi:hypothetical protein
MSDTTLRAKRTVGTGPPPDGLQFGEVAYADGEEAIYVGRADSQQPPARFANATQQVPILTRPGGRVLEDIAIHLRQGRYGSNPHPTRRPGAGRLMVLSV